MTGLPSEPVESVLHAAQAGTGRARTPEQKLGRTTYSFRGHLPTEVREVMSVRQKHGTDWVAAMVMAVVFALLFLALASIGLGMPIPFVEN